MSRVKIVILNWNGRGQLERFLPGVVATTAGLGDVVVADNGSTDDSLAWLAQHLPEVEVVRLDRNYGFAGGYNRALRQVDADVYVLLNSDVRTPAGWLEPLLRALKDPEVGAVAPKLRSCDRPDEFEYAGASGGFIDFFGYPFCRGRILQTVERDEGQYNTARDVFWATGAAFCCRAELFHRLGGFDDDFFAHMEEIDLCWRMQLAGYRIRIEPASCVYHVGGATLAAGSPRKVLLNHRNNLMMLHKCASRRQLLAVRIVRPWLDLLAALSYLVQGRTDLFRAVFAARREVYSAKASLEVNRSNIQKTRKKQPAGIYRGSILLRYAFGGRRFGKIM